ncbi:MAG TPA: hypothetical protein VFT98_05965, partial [Myxococcota bacterium]|nr:hypothetical protein [Myxococcota bacterium]
MGASIVALAWLATPASGKDLWERDWIEVRTEHFTVASALDEDDTVRLASELESFRLAVRRLLSARVEERVPTRVFLVPPHTKALGLTRGQIGWFRPEMRQNVAVVSKGGQGLSLSVVLFHEYAHFIAHNQNSTAYPPWFDEGFAEVLASMRFARGHALVGDLVRNRREWLQWNPWMSYSKILAVRDLSKLSSDETAMFYAQSWALAHYVLLGPHRDQFRGRMRAYLDAVEAGSGDDDAFAAAFGEDPKR